MSEISSTQALLLGRNAFPEFLHAAAHTRALSGAQSLDALALHALRPEVVIDHQADHWQSRHGQQPAQRGNGLAALQQDPDADHDDIERPACRKPELDVFVTELGSDPVQLELLSLYWA